MARLTNRVGQLFLEQLPATTDLDCRRVSKQENDSKEVKSPATGFIKTSYRT